MLAAAMSTDETMLKLLLRHSADVNMRINKVRSSGSQPLVKKVGAFYFVHQLYLHAHHLVARPWGGRCSLSAMHCLAGVRVFAVYLARVVGPQNAGVVVFLSERPSSK